MKSVLLTFCVVSSIFLANAQKEASPIIPETSYLVYSVDLGRIVKHMPVEEMNKYEFVQKITEEVSGSKEENANLMDLGVNFSQEIHVFMGKEKAFEFNGVNVILDNKESFLTNPSIDRKTVETLKEVGYSFEADQLVMLKNNSFVNIGITWSYFYFEELTDSIFDANNWERPYRWSDYDDYNYQMESEESAYEEEGSEPPLEEGESMYDRYDRILDSIREARKPILIMKFINSLQSGEVLSKSDENFKKVRSQAADGSLYINSQLLNPDPSPYYVKDPMTLAMERVYSKLWYSAYYNFTEEGMVIDWNTHADEKMMEVVQEAVSGKFNRDLLKYIPEYSQGFAVYNVHGMGAYEQMKESYMPVLDKSENPDYLFASAVWSTIDELIDVESVFDVYTADMFVSYNGMQDMMLEKTTYEYDKETYEYTERTESYLDKVPVLAFGLYTDKAYLLEKYLKAWRAYDEFEVDKIGDYYRFKRGPIGGTPYFLAIRDNVLLLTNDEDLVKNNLDGYGKNALSGDAYKKARKSKYMYANFDSSKLPEDLKHFVTNKREREVLDALKDKTATIEVGMKEISDKKHTVQVKYSYHGEYNNGVYYLMDLMNTVYLKSKR